MTMAPATRGLIARALRQREAVGRAGVLAADQTHAEREAARTRLGEEIARERSYAAGLAGESALPAVLLGVIDAAWRAAAAGRMDAAQREIAQAEAECDAARAVLAETARTAKGFGLLMERQDEDRARRDARRDPLPQMMALPRM